MVRALLPLNLLTLLSVEPQHGLALAARVDQATSGEWSPGPSTLYPLLQRLEAAGLVKSRREPSRGAPRRTYRLTAKGKRARERLEAETVGELRRARRFIDRHLRAFAADAPRQPHAPEEIEAALRGEPIREE